MVNFSRCSENTATPQHPTADVSVYEKSMNSVRNQQWIFCNSTKITQFQEKYLTNHKTKGVKWDSSSTHSSYINISKWLTAFISLEFPLILGSVLLVSRDWIGSWPITGNFTEPVSMFFNLSLSFLLYIKHFNIYCEVLLAYTLLTATKYCFINVLCFMNVL